MSWIIDRVAEWAISNLSSRNVDEWVERLAKYLLPKVRGEKQRFVDALKKAAARTDTKIDDAAVDALDSLLEAFLPDNAHCIKKS